MNYPQSSAKVLTKAHHLSAEDALQNILNKTEAVSEWTQLPILSALGRVLAEDVCAPINVPSHDNAAMDGYAIDYNGLNATPNHQSAEILRYKVIGRALAGQPFSGAVGAYQAVRITTGAVLPRGVDTVIPQEECTVVGDEVIFPALDTIHPEQHTRKAGEDLAQGAIALSAGKRVGPAEIGLLASLGRVEVGVKRKIRVAIFSTGDELVPLGSVLPMGGIHDSNRYTLNAMLKLLGAEVLDLGVLPDVPDKLEAAINQASAIADAVITTGGISMGEADYIHEILQKKGQVDFWKLAIRPGRPMAFGQLFANKESYKNQRGVLFFGLPGNPVAVMICFLQLVVPALRKMSGETPLPINPLIFANALSAFKKREGRQEYLRGILAHQNGELVVTLLPNQGSGVLHSMSEANCLVVLPVTCTHLNVGDKVQVQMLSPLFQ